MLCLLCINITVPTLELSIPLQMRLTSSERIRGVGGTIIRAEISARNLRGLKRQRWEAHLDESYTHRSRRLET
jgi:hypothetical protein